MPFVLFKVIQGVLECDCVAEKGCQGTDKHVSSTSSQLRLKSNTLTDLLCYEGRHSETHTSHINEWAVQ